MKTKRLVFVREYLVDLNASRAARDAGYAVKSSSTTGCRLLKVPDVRAAIEEELAGRAQRTQVAADRVLKEYARIAFADVRRFLKYEKGKSVELLPLQELSDDDVAAIAEVGRIGAASGPRLKLYDKQPALDALGRHLGLFGRNNAARTGDIRTAAQNRARAALKERIERIVSEREEGEAPMLPAPAKAPSGD